MLSVVTFLLLMTKPYNSFEDKEFIDFLFDKLLNHTDTDMIDLQDDASCCDHINFEQLEIEL